MRDRIFILLSVAVLIAAALSATVYGQNRHNHVVWEYGELVIQGDHAFFAVQEELHQLDPPSRQAPGTSSQGTDWGRVTYKTSVKLFHLNRLGQEGWEIISTAAIQDGMTYTVRRMSQ